MEGHTSFFDSDKKYCAGSNDTTTATENDVEPTTQVTTPHTDDIAVATVVANGNEPITVTVDPNNPDGSFVDQFFFDDDGYAIDVPKSTGKSAEYTVTPVDPDLIEIALPLPSSTHASTPTESAVAKKNDSAFLPIDPDAKPSVAKWNKYSANLLRTKRNPLLATKRPSSQTSDSAAKRVCAMDDANAALASTQRQRDELHALCMQRESIAIEREKMALANETIKNKLLQLQLDRAQSRAQPKQRTPRRRRLTDRDEDSESESEVPTPSEPSSGGYDVNIDHATYPDSKNNSPTRFASKNNFYSFAFKIYFVFLYVSFCFVQQKCGVAFGKRAK